MQLTLLDWLAIAAYFAANVAIGLYYRRRATASTADYFVSGRNVSLVAGGHVDGGHDLRRRHARSPSPGSWRASASPATGSGGACS